MNRCGSCTICCLRTEVPELGKAEGVLCPHCRDGCMIYESRPECCATFQCFWLAEGWPEDLRPDRCGVMFEPLPGVQTVLALAEDLEWMEGSELGRIIGRLILRGRPVIVRTPQDTRFFLSGTMTVRDVLRDIHQVLRAKNGCSVVHN